MPDPGNPFKNETGAAGVGGFKAMTGLMKAWQEAPDGTEISFRIGHEQGKPTEPLLICMVGDQVFALNEQEARSVALDCGVASRVYGVHKQPGKIGQLGEGLLIGADRIKAMRN